MSILFAILNILLIILKIIGLLLAFILLLVFIILAVKIKYYIYFKLDKDNKKELEIRVNWFGQAIKYIYKLGEATKLSIFNYFLMGKEKPKKKKSNKKLKNKKKNKRKKEEEIIVKQIKVEKKETEIKSEIEKDVKEENKEDEIIAKQIKVEKKETEIKSEIEKDVKEEKKEEEIIAKQIKVEKKETEIKSEIEKDLKEENEEDKEETKKSATQKINDFLEYPNKSDIINLSIGYLGKLLKIIMPNYFRIDGVLGFDSPDITGQVLGIIAIIRGQTGLDINIVGDFEKEIKAIEIEANGTVSLLKILIITIRFALRKPIWKIIKKYI